MNGPELARRSCQSLVPEHALCGHKTIHTQTDIDTICTRHVDIVQTRILHHILTIAPAVTETRLFESEQNDVAFPYASYFPDRAST